MRRREVKAALFLPAARAALLASMLVSCKGPGAVDIASEPFPERQREVERTLGEVLAAAGRKDIDRLETLHLYGGKFSKWDGTGPGRLDAEATRRAERAAIEALDFLRLDVEDLKVDVFGDAAVATFAMRSEAAAKGQRAEGKVRATIVWVKVGSGWKIVHEHFSPPPAPH
jgi:hypothetical protein